MAYDPYKIINGSFVEIFMNGEFIAEGLSVNAKMDFEKAQIKQSGNIKTFSKIIGTSGKGSIRFNKVSTRFKAQLGEYVLGKTPVFTVTAKISDPGSYGTESVTLSGCVFDDYTLANYEVGKIVEIDAPFTFVDAKFNDTIAPSV